MDKQKKQLVMLIALVVVAGIVAIFMVPKLFEKGSPPPLAGGDPNAAQPGQPAPGQPAPGQPAPAQPGAPGAPGTPGAVPAKDMAKPELKIPEVVSFTVDTKSMSDPLRVLEPDAVYSGQQEEVRALKSKWVLRGIAIMGKEVIKTFKKNPDGTENPVPEQIEQDIWACFFENNPRFYREGDRLEDTHFTVKSIHFDPDGAFVELEHDNGIRVKLHMITNDRYGKGK